MVIELKENSVSIDFKYMLLKRFLRWFIQEYTLICKTDVFMKCCMLLDNILKYPRGSHYTFRTIPTEEFLVKLMAMMEFILSVLWIFIHWKSLKGRTVV